MKSFLISIFSLAVLGCLWSGFSHYSQDMLHSYIDKIENQILINVEEKNWAESEEKLDELIGEWDSFKKKACFFYSTDDLNEVDYSFSRVKQYIKAEDDSNSSGELAYLCKQFDLLYFNESFDLQNLF